MVLGISASGRANGQTAKIVKGVLEASGREYSYVSLSGKRIGGCTGCLQCAGDGICKYRDDWNDIAHNVYFWLKPGLDDEALDSFAQGLDTLTRDPAAKGGHYGQPAGTGRGVVDNSYTYGLIVVFDDLAAHDRYQARAVHLEFLAAHAVKWERVVVYDFETP